jgi:hypothetical protein
MALTVPAAMSQEGQLDASPGLFTVMAAINAVGYAADLSSPNNHPLRDAIRAELAKRNIPSLPAIKAFFDQHRKNNDTDELSQYISFALTAGGPPDFAIQQRDVDLPPDAAPCRGFHRCSRPSTRKPISKTCGTGRNPLSTSTSTVSRARFRCRAPGERLPAAADLRGQRPPFSDLYRAAGGAQPDPDAQLWLEYTIVITPSPELRTFDVRHAYLHYLLDPLSTKLPGDSGTQEGAGPTTRSGPTRWPIRSRTISCCW